MYPIRPIKQTDLKLIKISKSEKACLEILIEGDTMNAYEIWKKSTYKHYTTVLRAVNKLYNKGIFNKVDINEHKKTNYYSVTFEGKLYFYLINNKEDKVIEFLKEKSKRFRDLSEIYLSYQIGRWVLNYIYEFINIFMIKKQEYNLDEIIENSLSDNFNDIITDLSTDYVDGYFDEIKDEIQKLITSSIKHEWIFHLLINAINKGLKWSKKMSEYYTKLNELLVEAHSQANITR